MASITLSASVQNLLAFGFTDDFALAVQVLCLLLHSRDSPRATISPTYAIWSITIINDKIPCFVFYIT
ncbi:hypothetical protein Q4Q39_15615 [Flavivirga amylovorans]|uniref:Uncharacterized protein n=1 Tax=Flavivirga amylovorans TaxID=870486 RepID=A0ABT8X581_9FLAO|nr:hypothetical protein [Flavivirga amylovorans]MDO5988838.1 hypothetical protein [Flavivirga amylovorans]